MKRILSILIISLLVIALIGCSSKKETVQSDAYKNVNNGSEDKNDNDTEDETPITEDKEEKNAEENETPTEPKEDNGSVEGNVKTDTGRYIGSVDSISVEIQISGVPDAISTRVFAVSEEVIQKIMDLNIDTNDVVQFNYYFEEELKRDLIIDIEKK